MRLLPLFESLGSDRFFKLLSAILCEQRVMFVADQVGKDRYIDGWIT